MGFSCGIVGLPNVGKSTLFNAITKAGVDSANYPFCTIDPHQGIVNVPDERLDNLAELVKTKKKTPTTVEFWDIAGLVKGASKGEGLGNKFLSNIRNTDAVIQVVRVFEDDDVTHIGEVDPVRDLDIINMELAFKDLETLENLIAKRKKTANAGDKDSIRELEIAEKLKSALEGGGLIRNAGLTEDEWEWTKQYQFLTAKPMLIVANIGEDEIQNYEKNPHYQALKEKAGELNSDILELSAKIEQEISELDDEDEKTEMLESLGLGKSGLDRLIVAGYRLLGLITFFTAGEKETRAWTVSKGAKLPKAAGTIHSDMQRGFIRGDVSSYEDFMKYGSWAKLKEAGVFRQEGKEYSVQDGDVVVVHFNV